VTSITVLGNAAGSTGIGHGFSPLQQDRLAVRTLENRKALGDIRKGKLREATNRIPSGIDAREELRNGITLIFTIDDVTDCHPEILRECIEND
jgi:hypothetical protein